MRLCRYIEKLSLKDLTQKREALIDTFSTEGIKFSSMGNNEDCINFIFSSGDKPEYLFAAHYDNFRGSFGANDNTASLCILIDLYNAFRKNNVSASFVFLDGEENNHSGALLYTENINVRNFSGVINLDLCGYGDSIVIHSRGKKLRRFLNSDILRRHNAQTVKFLPESDDVVFRKFHVPTLNIAIVPKWDVQYLKALASFGDRLLGMPPEFDMILSDMEVMQTIHNGSKDRPEFIQEEAMQKVYDYIFDAMTSKEEHINFFRRFIK